MPTTRTVTINEVTHMVIDHSQDIALSEQGVRL